MFKIQRFYIFQSIFPIWRKTEFGVIVEWERIIVYHKIWPILERALSIWFSNLDVLAKWPSNRGQCQRLPAFYSRTLSLLSNPICERFHIDDIQISCVVQRRWVLPFEQKMWMIKAIISERLSFPFPQLKARGGMRGKGGISRSQDEGASRKIGGVYPSAAAPASV